MTNVWTASVILSADLPAARLVWLIKYVVQPVSNSPACYDRLHSQESCWQLVEETRWKMWSIVWDSDEHHLRDHWCHSNNDIRSSHAYPFLSQNTMEFQVDLNSSLDVCARVCSLSRPMLSLWIVAGLLWSLSMGQMFWWLQQHNWTRSQVGAHIVRYEQEPILACILALRRMLYCPSFEELPPPHAYLQDL